MSRGLFLVNSAIWVGLAVVTVTRGSAGMRPGARLVIAALMVGYAGAMALAARGLGTGRKRFWT